MYIVLFHDNYDKLHLQQVIEEMRTLGAPTIRAFLNRNNEWQAVEGCHRIRAAKELGLTPIIKDISEQKTVTVQYEDTTRKYSVKALYNEMEGLNVAIKFDDPDDDF